MTRPYPANEHESMIGVLCGAVRKARASDVPGIVTLHQKAFSHSFLTRLGGEFLGNYYGLVLNYRAGIILVVEGQNVLEGFVCGFVDPAEFYQLMWRSRRTFALPVLSKLVRHPSLATKVLYGVQRIQTPAPEWPARSCELSSIAVAPEKSGNGLGKARNAYTSWGDYFLMEALSRELRMEVTFW